MRINHENIKTRSVISVWLIQFIGAEDELIKLMILNTQSLIRRGIINHRGARILQLFFFSFINGYSAKLNSEQHGEL
jgi:hypothetical protein